MISVILPVWINDEKIYNLTRNTLNSLSGDVELITIDNASSMGSDQLLKVSHIYLKNKENLGYVKAVNQGLELASGDLVAVANNDIRVSPNWWQVTQEIFDKLPKAGSLHFKMHHYDEPMDLYDSVWDSGKEKWCHCSFFVWRKKAIDEIGRMDENFGLGGYDDYDWQFRMRAKGWKTVYTNGAGFQHKDSSTQNLLDQEKRKKSDNKNYEYFKKKHGEYPDLLWNKSFPDLVDKPWRPFP